MPVPEGHFGGLFPPACRPKGMYLPAGFRQSTQTVACAGDLPVFARGFGPPAVFARTLGDRGVSGMFLPACAQLSVFSPAGISRFRSDGYGCSIERVFSPAGWDQPPFPPALRSRCAVEHSRRPATAAKEHGFRTSFRMMAIGDHGQAWSSQVCVPPVYLQ